MNGTNAKPAGFHTRRARKETLQVASLVAPFLEPGDDVLDIGCGRGYVLRRLKEVCEIGETVGADIVDFRSVSVPEFHIYDGLQVPLESDRFELVMLNFVLHHVPNETKPKLLNEARRLSRRNVFVLEDTPVNWLDRLFNRRHAERFRREFEIDAGYGFYSQFEWETLFTEMGFGVASSVALSRWSRAWRQPFARSAFMLRAEG